MSLVTSFNINGQEFNISSSTGTSDITVSNSRSTADFSISDENGYVITQFKDGHIMTKNFDSTEVLTVEDGTQVNGYDFYISDSSGNILVNFGSGHIKTKNFNSVEFNNLLEELENTDDIVARLYDDVGLQNTTLPLNNLLRGNSYMMCLQTWGIIGDSFTSGHQDLYTADGSKSNPNPRSIISWAGKMCEINHVDGAYFTASGQTAKNFIQSHSSYSWGVTGTDTTMACNNPRQAYVICLGINDWRHDIYANGFGTISDSVDFADYTLNDEETKYGCYFGIIQRIKSIQPKARIFVTSTKEWGSTVMNEVIQAAADNFTHTYYVDIYNYQKHFDYMFTSHPNQLGHVYFAYAMTTLIDKIIRDNFNDFIDSYAIGYQYDGYASGSCYQVNITVKNADSNLLSDEHIAIFIDSKFDRMVVTDETGVATVVLQNGDYTISPIKTKTFDTSTFTVNSADLDIEIISTNI